MEENNGRTVEPVNGNQTMEQLKAENEQLKDIINKAVAEVQQLRQTWALKRAEFLFKVIDSKEFNTEFKMKAVEELMEFLYPTKDNSEEAINNKGE